MKEKLACSLHEAAEATGYSVAKLRCAMKNSYCTARYAKSKPVILAAELSSWLESLPTQPPGQCEKDEWWLEGSGPVPVSPFGPQKVSSRSANHPTA